MTGLNSFLTLISHRFIFSFLIFSMSIFPFYLYSLVFCSSFIYLLSHYTFSLFSKSTFFLLSHSNFSLYFPTLLSHVLAYSTFSSNFTSTPHFLTLLSHLLSHLIFACHSATSIFPLHFLNSSISIYLSPLFFHFTFPSQLFFSY